jgi:hypothetical protein
MWQREISRPRSWSPRRRSNSCFSHTFTGSRHQCGGGKQAGQDPGVLGGEAADYPIYLQAAAINVAEGNKQAKILESEAEKQQLIISYIYRQLPSMWKQAGQDPGV